MEHTTISLEQAQRIIAACQSDGVPCFPRPVSHSNNWIKPLLDSGSDGLVVSTVNTFKEASKIVENMKYPPIGKRTYGVNRAQDYGINSETYFKNWNESSSLILQIETIEAVENINQILKEKEIDGIMIGPYDLSGSLGVPGKTNHPLVIEASNKVISACMSHGVSCGTQISETNEINVKNLFNMGYTFAILGSDLFVLSNWSKDVLDLTNKFKT